MRGAHGMTSILEEESRKRLHNAFEATSSIDTEVYHNSVDREYQLELVRILHHEEGAMINAYTDQRIAGMLLALGYSSDEIEDSIIKNSPMAVKPVQDQRNLYAKSIMQKAISFNKNKSNQKLVQNRYQKVYPDSIAWAGELPKQESFLIRPTYALHEIQSAMAKLLQVREDVILIVNTDEHEIPPLNDAILFLVDYSFALGDFPVHLSIYPQLPAFDTWHPSDQRRLAFIGDFCTLLACEALTEGNENPSIDQGWIVLKGNSVCQSVILDVEKILDDGSMVVLSNSGGAL
jgi:hypothetical protein